jgi:protocadherin-16/23
VITTITANDVDANPIVIYNFAAGGNPGSVFSIDRFSGRITLAKPLDHEKQIKYQLQLEASDQKHIEKTKVVINVLDDNDNSPIFAQKTYEVGSSLRELKL